VKVHVNGEPRDLQNNTSLEELIHELSLAAERVAIELNQSVVRRRDWPTTMLSEDDRVEIVHFVGGGCA
jgi:thiamine biosynthesis protein ThiS